ncbi:hypothetical protein EVA_14890, partial [gut metagenome]
YEYLVNFNKMPNNSQAFLFKIQALVLQ